MTVLGLQAAILLYFSYWGRRTESETETMEKMSASRAAVFLLRVSRVSLSTERTSSHGNLKREKGKRGPQNATASHTGVNYSARNWRNEWIGADIEHCTSL